MAARTFALQPLRVCTVTIFFVAIFANGVFAAPLSVNISPLVAQPRSGGPEWIEVRLQYTSAGLLEGQLELSIYDDDELAFIQRTGDLALTTGTRTFRTLLQGARSDFGSDREIRARFLTAQSSLDLGRFDLRAGRIPRQSVVLAIGRTGRRADHATEKIWLSLRAEAILPESNPPGTPSPPTGALFIEPEDFPTDALTYCAFDVVLLEPGIFGRLKDKAVAALGAWLEAGGSVCVWTDPDLAPERVQLLRAWLPADPQSGHSGQELPQGITSSSVGLGRLVVVTRSPGEVPLEETEWLNAVAWIWKLAPPAKNRRSMSPEYIRQQRLDALAEALLPPAVRVVPRALIIGLLAAFILLVGPLDYIILGKLRCRRFTWVFFPFVAVGFTALTMIIAGHFLGTSSYEGSMTITDLGADDRPVRETRFELTLPAREQVFTRATEHALASFVNMRRFQDQHDARRFAGRSEISGQFPARYTLSAPLRKWTPEVIRVTSFGGKDDSGIDWQALAETKADEFPAAAELRAREAGCETLVLHDERVRDPSGRDIRELLRILTVIDTGFSTGPNAGRSPGLHSMQDLPLLHEHAKGIVFVAFRRDGNDLRVWRRLYPSL